MQIVLIRSSADLEWVSNTVWFDRSLIALSSGPDVALLAVPLKVTSLFGRMKGAAI